ncbi:ANTAR domain-containing protein [Streptomyces qinglanensis]|uniref:ANTAR domain-containing protein n=1 Tax=Streptomyces qinglanensis TaxID=943816 RepID=A0A1H9W6C4_9ACTN|nr:ANTAR domain-containing protein [Streptomyces qinglanensis]SES29321.1 ANTAR domain-containing protein [Streptomyces qinglanensis]
MSAATGSARTSALAGCPRPRTVPPGEATAPAAPPAHRAECEPAAADGDAEPDRSADSGDAPLSAREREELTARIDALETEVGQLREALASRPVIDQARGMVMALAPCDAEAAWQVLVRVSQHSNVKLRSVAAALVSGAEGAAVPKPVRKHLATALREVRTAPGRRGRSGPSDRRELRAQR